MKNKLLLSSALVGSLAIAGIASAQTTISGSLDLSYKTISNEGAFTKRTMPVLVEKLKSTFRIKENLATV